MSKVINTAPAIDTGTVANARRAFIKGLSKTGDILRAYAQSLEMAFDVRELETGNTLAKWYELKGKDAKGVKAERAMYVSDMTEAGFNKGTIDVYWQRIKEASGYVPNGNRVKGAETTDTKTLTDLKTIINRIFKAEENGEEPMASDYKRELMDIFEALGGDIDKLG